jgi:hypothetical protein
MWMLSAILRATKEEAWKLLFLEVTQLRRL